MTPTKLTVAAVRRQLKKFCDPDKAAFFPRFFKAGPGEYAEGDKFLGVVVPNQRKVAKQFRDLQLAEVGRLLDDKFHECRLTGLLILVNQFQRADDPAKQKLLLDFYLSRTDAINNWDLVDCSAHKIVGAWLLKKKDRRLLDRLSRSKNMWEQRIAIIATLPLIHNGQWQDTIRIAERLLNHPHDLIHKAVGWMLREVGKQNRDVLLAFLNEHFAIMPRTMLRYSIEKLPTAQRQRFLKMKPGQDRKPSSKGKPSTTKRKPGT